MVLEGGFVSNEQPVVTLDPMLLVVIVLMILYRNEIIRGYLGRSS